MKRWLDIEKDTYHKIASVIQEHAIYEPNNSTTWNKVKDEVEREVDGLIVNCLSKWRVDCDDKVNTQETIEANEFHLKFSWKVKPDDEWTVVDFVVSPNGLNIS